MNMPLAASIGSNDWKQELRHNIQDLNALKEVLPLGEEEEQQLEEVLKLHPMNIPRYYMGLVDPKDPNDPIRNLCVPQTAELLKNGSMGETTADPYGDDHYDQGNGVLHKYGYTALVVCTEYCSMYCRHCFRKRMVGLPNDQTVDNFLKAAEYVAAHEEITNIVLSGGDPLFLPTGALRKMLDALKPIKHLKYVRIGSRAPVSFPYRLFDDELIELFEEFNNHKALYLPTHFNHPREITPIATEGIARVRKTGTIVNNQAVLLTGVNDNPESLTGLMQGLTEIGVNPYYLYQCMPVTRVRHQFQIPLKRAVDLVDEVRTGLDGYANRFKFIMGHESGKIEICGRSGDMLVCKRLHAERDEKNPASEMIFRKLTDNGGWLDDLEPIEL